MQTTVQPLWLASVVTLLITSTALAAGFRSFSRADQVHDSDLIVEGRVQSLVSYSNEPRSVIHTNAQVVVEDTWKGEPESNRITVRTLGGILDGIAMEVDGAARFVMGERVVLFLREENDDLYEPWGMRYGKYRVVGMPEEPFAIGVLPPSHPGGERFQEVSISLDELHDQVRSILDTPLGANR